MKVIFTEDIKGKGNKYDIKDIPSGYANFLIKEGKVLMATKENIDSVNTLLQLEKESEEQKIEQANDLKKYLEKLPNIKFYQYALPDGSTKESITKKDVINELKKLGLNGNEEVQMKPIKQFGIYDIDIKLYKNIKATLKIQILSL